MAHFGIAVGIAERLARLSERLARSALGLVEFSGGNLRQDFIVQRLPYRFTGVRGGEKCKEQRDA